MHRLCRSARAGAPALAFLSLALLCLITPTRRATARPALFVTQNVRWLRTAERAPEGSYWTSYTSVSWRRVDWRVRGSLSWLAWEPDGATPSSLSSSGFGSFYLTLGRRLWHSPAHSGWVQLRGKVPLQFHASPLGSGELDWGPSLLISARLQRLYLIGEGGYLELGNPAGVSGRGIATGSLTLSLRRARAGVYPIAGVVGSTSVTAGAPPYLELSGGVGAKLLRRYTLTVLASHGLTETSPELGMALALSLRR